jgi:hypothetical protein
MYEIELVNFVILRYADAAAVTEHGEPAWIRVCSGMLLVLALLSSSKACFVSQAFAEKVCRYGEL